MKFSIITVTYNSSDTIEDTLLSVLGQTHPNIEYIIIDGGSTDGTMEIIEKYRNRITRIISESDKGIYDAMNKGILLASGDYINFMNAGDRFVGSDILVSVADCISQYGEKDIIYGNTYKHNKTKRWEDLSHNPEVLKRHGAFCHQSCFVKTVYHKCNLFDLNYKYMADFNLFHKSYMNGATFLKLDIFVAEYNAEYGASLSQIERNYQELDEILVDTDTKVRRIVRALRHFLGRLKRRLK